MQTDSPARPIIDILRDHRSGEMLEDMTDKMHELISAIQVTGKKGELTLKLTIDPIKGDPAMVTMADEINVKMPKPKTENTIFYTTDDSNLQKRNPRQPDLNGLKEADQNASAPVEVTPSKETVEA